MLGIYRGSDDDTKLYVLGYQNSVFMLSRISTETGASLFDYQWDSTNFLGVYDNWLNFTGSYSLDRTLESTTEVIGIGITNTNGKLIFLCITIANDNTAAPGSPVSIILKEA